MDCNGQHLIYRIRFVNFDEPLVKYFLIPAETIDTKTDDQQLLEICGEHSRAEKICKSTILLRSRRLFAEEEEEEVHMTVTMSTSHGCIFMWLLTTV